MKNKNKYVDDTIDLQEQTLDLYKKYVDWKLFFIVYAHLVEQMAARWKKLPFWRDTSF